MSDDGCTLNSPPSPPKSKTHAEASDLPLRLVRAKGVFGQLWLTYISTLILSIATLTIYRFWGATRIRRQLWVTVSLLGDPFEYTGNGWELFVGFAKIVFYFILPFAVFLAILNFFLQSIGFITWEPLITFGTFIFFYWIFEVAVFLRFRYRVNRTSWRGIRARIDGNISRYMVLALIFAIAVTCSGMIVYPYAYTELLKYRLNCLSFGGLKIDCQLQSGAITGRYFICGTISITILTFIFLTMFDPINSIYSDNHQGNIESIGGLLSIFLLPLAILPFAWFWAKVYRAAAESVRIGEQRIDLAYEITGWRLARYAAGNWLIIIFSLGLLWPLTWTRKLDLICECLRIKQDIPVEALWQEDHDTTRIGEELGGGFEIG